MKKTTNNFHKINSQQMWHPLLEVSKWKHEEECANPSACVCDYSLTFAAKQLNSVASARLNCCYVSQNDIKIRNVATATQIGCLLTCFEIKFTHQFTKQLVLLLLLLLVVVDIWQQLPWNF